MRTTQPPARPPRLVDSVIELAAREGLLDAPATWRPPRLAHVDQRPELVPPAGDVTESGREGESDEDQREGDAQHGDTVLRSACVREARR